ncbi:MAG: type IV toxin-antitoxin system AbiEi family antitoxin domain-containing protein [candidate division WOR-3 bacterium]
MRIELIETLRRLGRAWYSIPDLEKITGLARPSLRVFLSRWTRAGRLERLGPGLYHLPGEGLDLERLGNEYYFPSYLSFESALARHGILSQRPYVLTFATTRRSRRLRLKAAELEYRRLRPGLYFGFEMDAGIYVARPEKALLDQLYMVCRGLASLDMSGLNLRPLNRSVLSRYVRAFPPPVGVRLGALLRAG